MEDSKGNKGTNEPNKAVKIVRRRYEVSERADVVSEIIGEYINDNKTLTNILSKNTAFPSVATFFSWLNFDPNLKAIYTHAREVKAHALIDEALKVAKGSGEDTVCKVQRDRLYSDRLIYAAAKYLPGVYGDKVDVTSGGEALNIVSLGVGIAPPSEPITIDITQIQEKKE